MTKHTAAARIALYFRPRGDESFADSFARAKREALNEILGDLRAVQSVNLPDFTELHETQNAPTARHAGNRPALSIPGN